MLCNLRILSRHLQQRRRPPAQLLMSVVQRALAQKVTKDNAASVKKEEEHSNEPLEFFGSQAATWQARSTRSGGADEALWYQPYVISGSLAIFMLYFFMLREESDIDHKLEGNLYEHVSGLEEIQLIVAYKYNKEKSLDTKDIEKRLTELGVDIEELEAQRLAELQ